jgi:hypothetical protein
LQPLFILIELLVLACFFSTKMCLFKFLKEEKKIAFLPIH